MLNGGRGNKSVCGGELFFYTDRRRRSSQVHTCNRLMSKAKSDYYTKLVSGSKTKPQTLLHSVNQLLHRQKSSPLPDCSDTATLADTFGTLFKKNIAQIRAIFQLDKTVSVRTQTKLHPTSTCFLPTINQRGCQETHIQVSKQVI